MRLGPKFACVAVASCAGSVATSAIAQAPYVELPTCGLQGNATRVSADGSTVVGTWSPNAEVSRAFRWRSATGLECFGIPISGLFPNSFANGASADGSIVVGGAGTATGQHQAVSWGPTGMVTLLPNLPGKRCSAEDVSFDGLTIVGRCWIAHPFTSSEAVRWVAGAPQNLGFLPGGDQSIAWGTSANGHVIVGTGSTTGSEWEAFAWTTGAGMVGLGDIPGGPFRSEAFAASADGSTIVGRGDLVLDIGGYAIRGQAFRWTPSTGVQGLGFLSGSQNSIARGVSADGAVVVGSSDRAFIWDDQHGMRDLRALLQSRYGVSLANRTLQAWGVSADGRVITGGGVDTTQVWPWNSVVWVAHLTDVCYPDCDASGTLTLADFGCYQSAFAQGAPYADCTADGLLTISDFGCFQAEFVTSCP